MSEKVVLSNLGGEEHFQQEPNSASLNVDWFSNPNNDFPTPFFEDFDFTGTGSGILLNRTHSGAYSDYKADDYFLLGDSQGEKGVSDDNKDQARKRNINSSEQGEEEEVKKKKRKKTVYETLHRQLSELVSAKLLVEVGTYATLLSAPQAEDVLIRKAIVKTFLHYRVRNVIQPSKWKEILDDSFVLDLPDTSIYRNSGIRNTGAYGASAGIGFGLGSIGPSSGGKRRIVGVNGIIQDVASVTSFLAMINFKALEKHKSTILELSKKKEHSPLSARASQLSSLSDATRDSKPYSNTTSSSSDGEKEQEGQPKDINSNTPAPSSHQNNKKSQVFSTTSPPLPINFCCRVKASDIVVDGPRLMCHWVFSTCGLSEYAGFEGKECGIDGMLKCNFNDKHKLVSMELTYDVLSFARQLSNLGLRADSQNHSSSSFLDPRLNLTSFNPSSISTSSLLSGKGLMPSGGGGGSSYLVGGGTSSVNIGGGMNQSNSLSVIPINSRAHRDSIAPLPPLRVTIPYAMRQSIHSNNSYYQAANQQPSNSSQSQPNSSSSSSSSIGSVSYNNGGRGAADLSSRQQSSSFNNNGGGSSFTGSLGNGFNLYQDPSSLLSMTSPQQYSLNMMNDSNILKSIDSNDQTLGTTNNSNSPPSYEALLKFLPGSLPPSLMQPPLSSLGHPSSLSRSGSFPSSTTPTSGGSSSNNNNNNNNNVSSSFPPSLSSFSLNSSLPAYPMSGSSSNGQPSTTSSNFTNTNNQSLFSSSTSSNLPTSMMSNNFSNINSQSSGTNLTLPPSMFPYYQYNQTTSNNDSGNNASTSLQTTLSNSSPPLSSMPSSGNLFQNNPMNSLNLPPDIQKIMAQNNGLIPIPLLNSIVNSLGLGNLMGNFNTSQATGGGGGSQLMGNGHRQNQNINQFSLFNQPNGGGGGASSQHLPSNPYFPTTQNTPAAMQSSSIPKPASTATALKAEPSLKK